MYLEHLIYSAALAIIVGMVFLRFTGRNQAWLIIPISLIPDLDHINNIIWELGIMDYPHRLIPYFSIGWFHNLLGITAISIGVAALLSQFKLRFIDVMIYSLIGCSSHLIEDYIAYPPSYQFLYPFSSSEYGINILSETGNVIIGDTTIIGIGLLLLGISIGIRYYATNNGWIIKGGKE